MLIRKHALGCVLVFGALTACVSTQQNDPVPPPTYPIPDAQKFSEYQLPSDLDQDPLQDQAINQPDPVITTSPDTIAESTPTSSGNLDTSWVQQQLPGHYTILIAQDSSAAHVAMALHQTPKNARMAEVKVQSRGTVSYAGVYGTYATYAEAQQALSGGSESMKSSGSIKTWSEIQQNILDTL